MPTTLAHVIPSNFYKTLSAAEVKLKYAESLINEKKVKKIHEFLRIFID